MNICNTIAGREYVTIEIVVTTKNSKKYDMMDIYIHKYECIMQGVKEIKPAGFWHIGYMIVRILVPSEFIYKFQSEVNQLFN